MRTTTCPPTPSPARTAALLIHGLGGTRHDFGMVYRQIGQTGIDTHAITLPGHGTTPDDLSDTRAEEWLDAVTTVYRKLLAQYDTVHVAGMCMGALLAILLCAREQHSVGRLVALSSPLRLDGWSLPWYQRLRHLLYVVPTLAARIKVEEKAPYGIKNTQVRRIVESRFARGDSSHYSWVPLACVREVDRLRRWTRREAARIACPTLIVHAREDELTSLESANQLQRRIPHAEVAVLENSYHMIGMDNDRKQVASQVNDFLLDHPSSGYRSMPMAQRVSRST